MKRLHSYLQTKSYLLVFDGIWTEDDLDCSEKIVKRSEGSPHVIVAVSNFLSKKPHTPIEFQNVHENLKYKPGDHVGHSYYSILSTSY
ncbi:hypothetical protein CFP56_026692 [Quercus suber]|uniref:NB-ARC domain-containing protein n=1 Tax=Quercus suber TaxID=58331 RepID=A0AAW0K194_QUESU